MADYTTELDFLKKFFLNLSIPFHIIDPEDTGAFVTVTDMGPHRYVADESQLVRYSRVVSDFLQVNVLYRVRNEMLCRYFDFYLGDKKNGLCVIGPYLDAPVTDDMLREEFGDEIYHSEICDVLREYYSHLKIVNDDSYIMTLLNTFGEKLWGGYSNFILKDIAAESIDEFRAQLPRPDTDYKAEGALIRMKNLAERYQLENELMEAISHGEVHRSEMLFRTFTSIQVSEKRTPDPVRNIKNYAIILNTLFRKAAEMGKVHPIYLDRTSSQLAKQIELCSTIGEITSLATSMVRKYALLVRNHSMSNYSPLIQQAMFLIHQDLTAELSLTFIAGALHVNASYLSSLFKKEHGITLTDYITQNRINHAIFLINSTRLPVSAIAQQCGIPDVQYFSKLFKRQVGLSPLQYRKMILGK